MSTAVSEKIISCFYDSSEDCVKVIDTDGILMSFNDNGLKVMEIDNANAVIGQSWLSFWKGDLEKPAKQAFETALGGSPSRFEGYCPTFKGTMKHWEVSIMPLVGDNGSVESLLVTSRDTTDVMDLKKKVQELEQTVAELQK